MRTNRRDFLTLTAAGLTAELLPLKAQRGMFFSRSIKAIAFDAFAIFDPSPIQHLAQQFFPEKGAALFDLWRTKQFEYQWLHTLIGSYADFWHCTEDSLEVAAKALNLDLTEAQRSRLMNCYLNLPTWPEVTGVLKTLKGKNLRLGFLSNATSAILESNIKNAGIGDLFERVLSTDGLRIFKPSPRAYEIALGAFALTKDEMLFVAFAGWDAAGAKAFGYPTFWMNRNGIPLERLGVVPDGTGKSLNDLMAFVKV